MSARLHVRGQLCPRGPGWSRRPTWAAAPCRPSRTPRRGSRSGRRPRSPGGRSTAPRYAGSSTRPLAPAGPCRRTDSPRRRSGRRTWPRRRSRPGRCRRAGEDIFWKIGDNVTHAPSCRPSGTRWMACKSRPAPQASALHTLRSRRRQRWRWRSRSAVIVSRHTAPRPRQWQAATPVFHHQQQAWGGWPAARLTAPRVAFVHRRAHRDKCQM